MTVLFLYMSTVFTVAVMCRGSACDFMSLRTLLTSTGGSTAWGHSFAQLKGVDGLLESRRAHLIVGGAS